MMHKAVMGSFIAVLSILLNIPLGYWRASLQKLTFKWFVAIHLSVPIIVAARIWSTLEYEWIPIFIMTAIAGQLFGGKAYQAYKTRDLA
jgi:hypothetical protein